MERALDELGLAAPHLCGNSLGGWVALELARRRRARSLVLISPAGFWSDAERRYALASLKLAHRQARVLAPLGRAAMALPPARTLFFGQIRRRPRRLPVREAAHQVRESATPAFARTRDVVLDGRRVQRLHEVACPTLLLWGTRDLLLPVRQAADALVAIPGAQLVRLRGLGHVPMADDPRRVAGSILDFTSRVPAPGRPRSGHPRSPAAPTAIASRTG